jgi:predicted nucleic acid-binding protein
MKIFLDEIAWSILGDSSHPLHHDFSEQFKYYLDGGHSFYTTNIIFGNTISQLKKQQGVTQALRFSEILEEAWLGTHLHFLWIGRRTQRDALKLFKKFPEEPFSIFDFANVVLMNRRNIRFIMTTNLVYSKMGFKIVPESLGKK